MGGRVRFTSDRSTTVAIVNTDDLIGVDTALANLCEHQILGLAAFWEPEETAEDYEPIAVLVISAGAVTVMFRITVAESLPMGIQLLLTHQDYIKIICGLEDGVVGKLWRDFGIELSPLHDCKTIMEAEYGVEKLFAAYKRICPGSLYKHDPSLAFSEWNQAALTQKQTSFAAFEAWATRLVWMTLAKPSGFPPTCKTTPIDTSEICDSLTCPFCQARLHGPAAMQAHIFSEHSYNCHLCGLVARSAAELDTHMAMNHVRCPDCGEWVVSPSGMAMHEADAHVWPCRAGCGAVMRSEEALLGHMQERHAQCHICGEWFLTPDDLQQHQDKSHPVCSFCGRSFPSAKALKQHQYARVNNLCKPNDGYAVMAPYTLGPQPTDQDTYADDPSYGPSATGTFVAGGAPAPRDSRRDGTFAGGDQSAYGRGGDQSVYGRGGDQSVYGRGGDRDQSSVMPPPHAQTMEHSRLGHSIGGTNRSMTGSRYGQPHGRGRQDQLDRPTHLDEPAGVAYPTNSTAATLNRSMMEAELANETLRNLTLGHDGRAYNNPPAAATGGPSGRQQGRQPSLRRQAHTPARTPAGNRSPAPSATSTPRRRGPGGRAGAATPRSAHRAQPGQAAPTTPSTRGGGRAYRTLFTSPGQSHRLNARRDQSHAGQHRTVSFAAEQDGTFGVAGVAGVAGETLGGDQSAGFHSYRGPSSSHAHNASTGNLTRFHSTDKYAGRIAQGKPGSERWVEPPFREHAPLKLANTADEVGLVGN